jgi:deoxyadenosine/deoxycytidine kinase
MHKIAFSGIPGSGKTSILTEVKKILSFKSRVEDVPDLRLSSPFDFDQKAGFVSQFFFISNQINEENIRSLSQPNYLLCDCSILDHWLKWQKYFAKKKTNDQIEDKNKLLRNLYQFWVPSYTITFRIRVDAKELEKRIPKSGLHGYELGHSQTMDELYSHAIMVDQLNAIDIWNHQSIDESAQEVLKKIADLKLL